MPVCGNVFEIYVDRKLGGNRGFSDMCMRDGKLGVCLCVVCTYSVLTKQNNLPVCALLYSQLRCIQSFHFILV
jgi:hypothetical protein